MSHPTTSSIPIKKISSPENTNVYDVVISAHTLKRFSKIQKCKLSLGSYGMPTSRQVRSGCLACTFRASYCSARLSRAHRYRPDFSGFLCPGQEKRNAVTYWFS